jgi:hypothetical protein
MPPPLEHRHILISSWLGYRPHGLSRWVNLRRLVKRERIYNVIVLLRKLCVLHTRTWSRLVHSFQRSSRSCSACIASCHSRIDTDAVSPAGWTSNTRNSRVNWIKLACWTRRRLVAIQLSLINSVCVHGPTSKVTPSRRFLLKVATIRSPWRMEAHWGHYVFLTIFYLLLSLAGT